MTDQLALPIAVLVEGQPVRSLDVAEADSSHGCAWPFGCEGAPSFRVTLNGRGRDYCDVHVADALLWDGTLPVPYGGLAAVICEEM